MASSSNLNETPLPHDDDDDETLVDDTLQNDHVELSDDSKSSDTVKSKSSRKRKQPRKKKASKKKTKMAKKGGERSVYWEPYDVVYLEEEDGVHRKYGKCKWCKEHFRADPIRNGTSGLKKHTPACPKNPEVNQKQTNLVFQKETNGEGSVTIWKHDDSRINKALLDLFIVAELPFKLVENPAFIEYTNALNGKYNLPSRHKLSKDIAKYYIEERNKLLAYVSKPTNTVHLTTDTWTSSCHRVNYMVLTAHFIDDDWVMHKRIINFRPINSHRGEDVGQEIMHCIHGWGIKNVMTMTVDNASSNDKVISYMLRKLPNLYDEGRHFHIRCMAHILNLIVKDGLSENTYHVDCIRKAVRHIRNSTQRITKFKKCMEESSVQSSKFLCGDMATRWNSTYEMLKTAVDLREVFFSYELQDSSYKHDLERLPEHSDFGACENLVEFLKKFKTKTEIASATSKPLAHVFVREILDVDKHLRVWDCDPSFSTMVRSMRLKYDKYWGKLDKLNDFMYFAIILDPTMKLYFIEHCYEDMIISNKSKDDNWTADDIKKMVATKSIELESRLHELFQTYKERLDKVDQTSASQEASNDDVVVCDDGNEFFMKFLKKGGSQSACKETELERYLKEQIVDFSMTFDILKWWKQNAIRFPIVSRMARDILAIQISTVASESAFSTGGRVLDAYRTRLSTNIVEALICTQDWVRKSKNPIVDDVDDILKDDDVAIAIEDAIRKQNEKGKGIAHEKE